MDLEELKSRLAAQDEKLDQALRLHTAALRELQLGKTKASLRGLTWGLGCEIVLAILAVVGLGDFLFTHLSEPRFFLPGLLVDLGAIFYLGALIRQLAALANLDYGLPVVAVQKTLGRLRVLRLRTTKWTAVLAFLLWFPALVVLVRGVLGVDLWRVLGAAGSRDPHVVAWMAGNVLFGLAAALVLIGVARRYGERMESSPRLRRLLDDLAGRSLARALRSLDTVTRFAAEP